MMTIRLGTIILTKFKRNSYEYAAALLLTFIVLLPKGGIKVAGIPLTVGYAVLFLLAGLSFTAYTYTGKIRFLGKNHFICLLAFFPFFILSTFKIIAAGYESLGFLFSFYASLFFIPAIFLLLFYHPLKHVHFDIIKSLLVKFVFLTAIYGIFLFFFKFYTGKFIEIPLLTVNLGDVGELENKHINRGGIFKLISTYNNGNIYGVCMLMFLPFYSYFEKKTYKKLALKLALFLTLSRTVWIGLLLFELLNFIFIKKKNLKSLLGILVAILGIFLLLLIGLSMLNRNILFLLDASFGGRVDQLESLYAGSFWPDTELPFSAILEMVYFSIINQFGWIGLFSFLAYLIAPLFLFLTRRMPNSNSYEKKTLALGLFLYLIVAAVDGALLYIPVMAIYWLIVALLLSNYPSQVSR